MRVERVAVVAVLTFEEFRRDHLASFKICGVIVNTGVSLVRGSPYVTKTSFNSFVSLFGAPHPLDPGWFVASAFAITPIPNLAPHLEHIQEEVE
jgi:hypothetical protein